MTDREKWRAYWAAKAAADEAMASAYDAEVAAERLLPVDENARIEDAAKMAVECRKAAEWCRGRAA